LYHAVRDIGALMAPDLPLTRRQHELINDGRLGHESLPILN